jgi:hypothetical protein
MRTLKIATEDQLHSAESASELLGVRQAHEHEGKERAGGASRDAVPKRGYGMSEPKESRSPRVVRDLRDNPEYRRKVIAGTESGWEYQRCATAVGSRTDEGRLCMLCNAPMRFGHVVTYPKELKRFPGIVENQLSVGVECAIKLIPSDQADIPRLAENETARKERWRRDVFGTPGICKTTIDDLIEKGKL